MATENLRTAPCCLSWRSIFCPTIPHSPSRFAWRSDDPDAYLAQYEDEWQERGIDEAHPDLPWIALADGLRARGWTREIDWKTAIEDILWTLDELAPPQPPNPDRWEGLTDEEAEDDRVPEETLPLAGRRLLAEGLALATNDIDSDGYLLIVLPADRLEEAQRLAKRAGYGTIAHWA